MSNRLIDNLFYETLVEGLTSSDGKLSTLVKKPSILLSLEQERMYDDVSRIDVSLVPAPSATQTLSGDHKRFTGLYQMDVKVLMDEDDETGDFNNKLYDLQDKLQEIFEVDKELTNGAFSVRVISPLIASEARQFKQWWTCHCYFNYRADTN